MIRRLRSAFGGETSGDVADAAVGRGMAGVLTALDNVIDDDAALRRIYARHGGNVPCGTGGSCATGADKVCAATGTPGPGISPVRPGRSAPSHRRAALCSVAGAAAALTAAVVTLTVIGVPGAHQHATGRPAGLAAYVVKRVDSALNAAGPAAIAQMTVVTRSGGMSGGVLKTAEEWSYGDRWRAVTYSAAGHLVYDEGVAASAVYTVVSYRTHTWARQHGLGHPAALAPGPRGCAPVVAALPLLFQPGPPGISASASWLPATIARALRAAVSCGALAVAGPRRVDGKDVIELTSRPDSMIPETVWVSRGTYLPVRVIVRPVLGSSGPLQTADISWLPLTAQNLAKLAVPIPAGFREVPVAEAVTPSMQRVPS
jgi:hypothetical protein